MFIETFGDCVSQIMQKRGITIAQLQRKLGLKSATSIYRVIRNECSYKVMANFLDGLLVTNFLLLSADEIEFMKQTLIINKNGIKTHQAYRKLNKLFFSSIEDSNAAIIRTHDQSQITIESWMKRLSTAKKIDGYIFGGCVPALFDGFASILKNNDEKPFHLNHYFEIGSDPLTVVNPLICLIAVLRYPGYTGYYKMMPNLNSDQSPSFLRNCVMLWVTMPDGTEKVHELRMINDELFLLRIFQDDASLRQIVKASITSKDMREYLPARNDIMQSNTYMDLISLYKKLLFMEKDRTQRVLWQSVCVSFVPAHILLRLAHHYPGLNLPENQAVISAIQKLHIARHENIFEKKQPSHIILNKAAMKRFANEGYLYEHPLNLPPFLPSERVEILKLLIDNCRNNVYFHIYIAHEDLPPSDVAFMSFGGLGLHFYDANTNYDTTQHLYEALLSIDAFTALFDNYFDSELLMKHVYCESESIAFLECLIHDICENENTDSAYNCRI